MWTKGAEKNGKNALQPAPVGRLNFQYSVFYCICITRK